MKAITKGLNKAFKSVTDSGVGKGVLLAATVYTGGSALGLWDGPFNGMHAWAAKPTPDAASPAPAPATPAEAPVSEAPPPEALGSEPMTPTEPPAEKSFLWLINSDFAKGQAPQAQPALSAPPQQQAGLLNRNMVAA
jgi:hypothetical protein